MQKLALLTLDLDCFESKSRDKAFDRQKKTYDKPFVPENRMTRKRIA